MPDQIQPANGDALPTRQSYWRPVVAVLAAGALLYGAYRFGKGNTSDDPAAMPAIPVQQDASKYLPPMLSEDGQSIIITVPVDIVGGLEVRVDQLPEYRKRAFRTQAGQMGFADQEGNATMYDPTAQQGGRQ